jgi:hypothetical protein
MTNLDDSYPDEKIIHEKLYPDVTHEYNSCKVQLIFGNAKGLWPRPRPELARALTGDRWY